MAGVAWPVGVLWAGLALSLRHLGPGAHTHLRSEWAQGPQSRAEEGTGRAQAGCVQALLGGTGGCFFSLGSPGPDDRYLEQPLRLVSGWQG